MTAVLMKRLLKENSAVELFSSFLVCGFSFLDLMFSRM